MILYVLGFVFLLLVTYLIRLFWKENNRLKEAPGETIAMEDMEPVNYAEIMNCERPYVDHQFN